MDGYGLAALIFAREVSGSLIGLVKAIDKQLEPFAGRPFHMERPGVHVVFCSDDPNLKERLDALIAREGIKHVVFSISKNKAQGPPRYRIAREAELTVVIYRDQDVVVSNYVLDSIGLTAEKGDEIVKSLKQVLR